MAILTNLHGLCESGEANLGVPNVKYGVIAIHRGIPMIQYGLLSLCIMVPTHLFETEYCLPMSKFVKGNSRPAM
jgi:hypothetical protein